MRLSFTDLRDGLVLVDFPDASSDAANRAAVGLSRALATLSDRGLRDAVPAARTLLLSFDPLRLTHEAVRRAASRHDVRGESVAGTRGRTLEIPAVFDGEDLGAVAAAAALSPRELVGAFLEAEYRVAFLGFAPGFPYLAGLPERLRVPRLPTPRVRVPAGSVAIAGEYAGIYPSATPGGWRLVGSTRALLFDARRDPPALFAAGDRVRFTETPRVDAPAAKPDRPPPSGAIFRVARAGLWTAAAGAPRYGLASSGVPPGGPMDAVSAAAANAAARNPAEAGVLELAVDGPELEALAPCVAAVAGADVPVSCGGAVRPHGQPFAVAAGDRIIFGRARKGMRAYLAVEGGLRDAEETAGTRRLERGDLLVADAATAARGGGSKPRVTPVEAAPFTLRAVPGPHAAMFTAASLDAFFAREWRVSRQSDRRGLRLDGAPLDHVLRAEVEPVGAAPGSVQVPGGGLPIVLGPDGPVTGGYPRIATVIGADLHRLGQAAPGEVIRFVPATLSEALHAAGAREYD